MMRAHARRTRHPPDLAAWRRQLAEEGDGEHLDPTLSRSATRWPESEVSAARSGHSRVKMSTTVRIRNGRPSSKVSRMKSMLHCSFGAVGVGMTTRRWLARFFHLFDLPACTDGTRV